MTSVSYDLAGKINQMVNKSSALHINLSIISWCTIHPVNILLKVKFEIMCMKNILLGEIIHVADLYVLINL